MLQKIMIMLNNDLQPMVGVAQLVEHWVVAPVVVGSSPITHPINLYNKRGSPAPSFIDLSPSPTSLRIQLQILPV